MMKNYTKLEVIGWGCPQNTTCELCGSRPATVLVAAWYDHEEYPGYPLDDQLFACNACTATAVDPIAEVFNKLAEKLKDETTD